ncbi:GBS Bsp-like repeat-containing protein [Faecalicatena fissicatena]|uniref:GBS Bsp-like repeat-containing protein n=1 Tax=Faecalicatena fissicatena TaxID=290055 RepID=A0ABS2E8T3_9FIRM|nr:GBS Bsp-like repeat-containing protein [Faecalicatena fissicatena]MBM6737987.1 GBS Bsp-like repeat-containing protein [Faecalicatena fissicatena]
MKKVTLLLLIAVMASFLFANNTRASEAEQQIETIKDSNLATEEINAIEQPGNQEEEESDETEPEDTAEDFSLSADSSASDGNQRNMMQYSTENIQINVESRDSVGEYQISCSGVDIPSLKVIQFAVWSDQQGQDDLVWYDGYKMDKNSYGCSVDIRNHSGLGKYNVHVYALLTDGVQLPLGQTAFDISLPTAGQIYTDEVDIENGKFNINVQDITNSQYIKKMEFAVWSEDGGQDDIRWYDVKEQNGKYVQTVNIASHNYSVGEYIIHIYITDITNQKQLLGTTSQNLAVEAGNLEIIEDKEALSYTVKLQNLTVPGGALKVQFPVWSAIDGQDDICWYDAKKNADGEYILQLNLKNHKGLGKYNVHAYITTKSGKLIFLSATDFETDSPQIGEIQVNNNQEDGTFQIKVSALANGELIEKLRIPVWSEEGGQDDIIWYEARRNGDEFSAGINIKNHKYTMGRYIAHIYVTDITGYEYYVGNTENSVSIEIGDMKVSQKGNEEDEFEVRLTDVVVPGGDFSIVLPTWSKVNGQDDIRWYTAKKEEVNTYTYTLSVKNHKGLGEYYVHAYAKMPDGTLIWLAGGDFETLKPSVGEVQVNNEEKVAGKFQVKVTGVQNSNLIEKIQIPIWASSDQNDIVWYTAYKDDEDNYIVDANIGYHKYNIGTYKIHVYMTDITGVMQLVGNSSCNMNAEYSSFTASDEDGKEKTYDIQISGLKIPAGEEKLSFAIWGAEGGQNDIIWYTANRVDNGKYNLKVDIRDHKELGQYNVHAYCTTKGGAQSWVGVTSFEVKEVPRLASVQVSNVDGTKGRFTVTITGLYALSGIERVQVPVWCEADQNDIVWYDAMKLTEGTYTVNVEVANHKHHFGNYTIHIYPTMGNGIRVKSGAGNAEIYAQNYVYHMQISSTQMEVGIMGATANRVQFPTWSTANGQDDIIWYEGNNCGGGKWNVAVDSANHVSGGEYMTHVYVTSGGVTNLVGTTSYSLTKIPTALSQMQARANLYSSSTPFLILVNRSNHKVGIFQGWQGNWNCIQFWDCSDGKTSTPTVEGVFRVGSKGHHFFSGDAICYWWTQFYGDYLFHSVLYNRYNGSLMDGRLGMGLSHGCVRLDINNAKWIYDTIPSGTTVVVYH